MALTLESSPNQWQAAHKPLKYIFSFSPDLTGLTAEVNSTGQNQNGKLAVMQPLNYEFEEGQSFFIAFDAWLNLYQPETVTVTDVITIGPDTLAVLDLAYPSAPFSSVQLYNTDEVRAYTPAFNVYLNDDFAGSVNAVKGIDGKYILDVQEFVKTYFADKPAPIVGVDPALSVAYRVDYGQSNHTSLTEGVIRYALDSVVQPPTTNNAPVWAETGNTRCETVDGENTGFVESQEEDTNECSPTFGQTRWTKGEQDLATCPLPVDSEPDWQFAGAAVCVHSVPRSDSNQQRRKQDANPNSASYQKWLGGDGLAKDTEAEGAYFFSGADETACPVAAKLDMASVYTNESSQHIAVITNGGSKTTSFSVDLQYSNDGADFTTIETLSDADLNQTANNIPISYGPVSGRVFKLANPTGDVLIITPTYEVP